MQAFRARSQRKSPIASTDGIGVAFARSRVLSPRSSHDDAGDHPVAGRVALFFALFMAGVLSMPSSLSAQRPSPRGAAKFAGWFEQRLLERANLIVVARPERTNSGATTFGLVRVKVVETIRPAGEKNTELLVRGVPPKFDPSSEREQIFFLRRDDASKFAELVDLVTLPDGDRAERLSYLAEMLRIAAVVGNDKKLAALKNFAVDALQSKSAWCVSNAIREVERIVALVPADFSIESINRLFVESTVPTFADDLVRLAKCRERVAEVYGLAWVLRSNGLGEKERRALINDVVAAQRSTRIDEVHSLLDDIAQTFGNESSPLFAALIEHGAPLLAKEAIDVVAKKRIRGTTKALAEFARRPGVETLTAIDAVRALGKVGEPETFDSLRLLAQRPDLESAVHEAMARIGSTEMRLFLIDRLRELERLGRGSEPIAISLRRHVDEALRARGDSVDSRPTSAPTSRPSPSRETMPEKPRVDAIDGNRPNDLRR